MRPARTMRESAMPTEGAVITVNARIAGQRRPVLANWRVPLPAPPTDGADAGIVRLRDLLAHIVRQEVHAFQRRQQEQRVIRILSPDQIQQAATTGKIAMGGVDESASQSVDEETAVATALQAFTDGLYFVFLDHQQQQDLDAEVRPRPESALTFIRLVALAGG